MKAKNPPYSSKIFWSAEDACFVAGCAEFPGLSGLGESKEDALNELNTALELAIEELQAAGKELPQPISPPSASGQFRLRLPKSLHENLQDLAELEGVSLNTLAVSLLARGVGESADAFADKGWSRHRGGSQH